MDKTCLRRWSIGLWLTLALLAGLIWSLRFWAALRLGPCVHTTSGEENSLLNISLMRFGEPVYVDCYVYPYRSSLFNWLYYYCYAQVLMLVQPSDLALPTTLRCLTVAWAVLGFLATLHFLRLDEPAQREPAPLVVILCLALVTWFGPVTSWWTMTARPDMAAVACEFAAFSLVARAGPATCWRRMLLAGLLFFAAWSFKQNEIVLLAGACLGLLWLREWQHFAIVAGVFAGLTATVLLVQSDAYYTNVFDTVRLAPWSFGNALSNFRFWMYTWGFLLCTGLTVAMCCGLTAHDLVQDRQMLLTAITLAVAVPLNFMFSARIGAWSNYFFESWLAGMGLTGLAYLHAFRSFQSFAETFRRRLFAAGNVGMLVLAVGYTLALFPPLIEFEKLQPVGEAFGPEAIAAMQASPRPIFNDHPTLACVALGKEAGEVPMIDYTIYGDALRAGRFADGGIGPRIRQRWFGSLWLDRTENAWEEEALAAGYVLQGEYGTFRQYVRPGDASP